MASGTIVERNTARRVGPRPAEPIKHSIQWASAADGTVNQVISGIAGCVMRVVFKPGADAVQPSAAYDVTLKDAEGIDILGGLGANLSNAAASECVPVEATSGVPRTITGDLTLDVTNAGDSKGGWIILYVR